MIFTLDMSCFIHLTLQKLIFNRSDILSSIAVFRLHRKLSGILKEVTTAGFVSKQVLFLFVFQMFLEFFRKFKFLSKENKRINIHSVALHGYKKAVLHSAAVH